MSDADFMLAVLEEREGEWVAQHEILERSQAERGCGMTVHSRASTLRERGLFIACDVRVASSGRRISFYRLLASPLIEPETAHHSGSMSGAALAGLDPSEDLSPSLPRTESEEPASLFEIPPVLSERREYAA